VYDRVDSLAGSAECIAVADIARDLRDAGRGAAFRKAQIEEPELRDARSGLLQLAHDRLAEKAGSPGDE